MIERLDALLIGFYEQPLRLLVITLVPALVGLAMYAIAPHIAHQRGFFLPLLGIHRAAIGLALIGVTISLIFFAQHESVGRSLALFALVGVLILGSLNFLDQNPFERVRHERSVRIGWNTYHLGVVNVLSEEGYILRAYAMYRCDLLGAFCRQLGRDIVPSVGEGALFQNDALVFVEDGELAILDGGTAEVLFAYRP